MENPDKEILVLKQQLEAYKKMTDKEIETLRKVTDDQEKRIRQMEMSKEKTDFQYEEIMKTLNKLNDVTIPSLTAQIEELKNKPVKRYDQAIGSILGAIFGAIGGAIAGLFLK